MTWVHTECLIRDQINHRPFRRDNRMSEFCSNLHAVVLYLESADLPIPLALCHRWIPGASSQCLSLAVPVITHAMRDSEDGNATLQYQLSCSFLPSGFLRRSSCSTFEQLPSFRPLPATGEHVVQPGSFPEMEPHFTFGSLLQTLSSEVTDQPVLPLSCYRTFLPQ